MCVQSERDKYCRGASAHRERSYKFTLSELLGVFWASDAFGEGQFCLAPSGELTPPNSLKKTNKNSQISAVTSYLSVASDISFYFIAHQPVCGQWTSQVSRGSRVLVKMPPQGNLGRGEARVIWKSIRGTLLPLTGIRGGRYNLVVRGDGQVARKKLALGVGPVKTG